MGKIRIKKAKTKRGRVARERSIARVRRKSGYP